MQSQQPKCISCKKACPPRFYMDVSTPVMEFATPECTVSLELTAEAQDDLRWLSTRTPMDMARLKSPRELAEHLRMAMKFPPGQGSVRGRCAASTAPGELRITDGVTTLVSPSTKLRLRVEGASTDDRGSSTASIDLCVHGADGKMHLRLPLTGLMLDGIQDSFPMPPSARAEWSHQVAEDDAWDDAWERAEDAYEQSLYDGYETYCNAMEDADSQAEDN